MESSGTLLKDGVVSPCAYRFRIPFQALVADQHKTLPKAITYVRRLLGGYEPSGLTPNSTQSVIRAVANLVCMYQGDVQCPRCSTAEQKQRSCAILKPATDRRTLIVSNNYTNYA